MHTQQDTSRADSPLERLSKLRALHAAQGGNETAIGAWAKEMRAGRHARDDTPRHQKGGLIAPLVNRFKSHCKLYDNSPRYADKEFSLKRPRPESPELRSFYRDEARLRGFFYGIQE